MKLYLVFFVVIVFLACAVKKESTNTVAISEQNQFDNKDTVINGKIESSKAGFILNSNENIIYLNRSFPDSLLNFEVKVFGKLYSQNITEDELGYKTKEYYQGVIGYQLRMVVDSFQVILKK